MTAEDPYASMEKDQLISMIHFLVKHEDERAQENQELKDIVKKRTWEISISRTLTPKSSLMKSIDRLTNQVANITTQNRMISERIAELVQTLPSRYWERWTSTRPSNRKSTTFCPRYQLATNSAMPLGFQRICYQWPLSNLGLLTLNKLKEIFHLYSLNRRLGIKK